MFNAESRPSHCNGKLSPMKQLTLLLLLMMTSGLCAESGAFSTKAAAAGAPGEGVGARPMYEYDDEHQVNALDEKKHSNERRVLPAGPTDGDEVKRLKLILLLMMSLGQERAPRQ
jgi:hypothetical protein